MKYEANAGPPKGDHSTDRAINALPLPQYPIAPPVAAGSVDTESRKLAVKFDKEAREQRQRAEKAEARVKELEADAMRWRYLRDLNHEITGTAGQPCVALPNGMNSGYYLTGPEAIYAVDMSMAEAKQK